MRQFALTYKSGGEFYPFINSFGRAFCLGGGNEEATSRSSLPVQEAAHPATAVMISPPRTNGLRRPHLYKVAPQVGALLGVAGLTHEVAKRTALLFHEIDLRFGHR